MTGASAVDLDAAAIGSLFCDGENFLDLEGWHRSVDRFRSDDPLLPISHRLFDELFAVTSLETLLEVSRRPDDFANTSRPMLMPMGYIDPDSPAGQMADQINVLVNSDGHEHQAHRKVVVDWFKNSALATLRPAVDDLVADSMALLRERDGECDFSTDVALPLPLRVIMSMLGVPPSDEPVLLKLTQEMFSSEDPELGEGDPLGAMLEVAGYFMELIQARQANPTDDLSSTIAHGVVDGTPIETMAALGLFVIISTAGHDTTSFAMAGGVDALTRHPDQFARLRAEPDLADNAAYECVRLTSPVRHFLRYATCDTEVFGAPLSTGDRILLSYPAANRDPAIFEDPHRLDVARPNASRQIGWGHGAHFCLGSRLAHMEVAAVLRGLATNFTSIESTGPTQWTKSTFVGGAKHVPVRLRS